MAQAAMKYSADSTETAEGNYFTYETLRKQYLDWSNVKRSEIDEQREARRYYHGDQYTDAERKVFKKRKQPAITFNRTARKIDGIVGLLERLRQDAKAFPRTPQHEQGAEIASVSLRYALDNANWQQHSAEAERVAAVDGIGGIELGLEPGDLGDQEITLAPVDIDTFFYDPRSFRHDFSDARFMGVAKWMDLADAQALFPEHAEELAGLIDSASDNESGAQQDRERKWIDSELKRVFVVEHWYRHFQVPQNEDKWCFCFYVKSLKLKEGESPFFDDKDKTICRFRMFSANVDHQGDRYGFIRNMKSAQDEINHRRSRALHLIHSRRIVARQGSLGDIEKARKEAARPDGVIEWNTEEPKFEDVKSQSDFQAQFEMLQEAKAEIDGYGPNPQLVGETRGEKSGRAIALLQQAGIAELGPYIRAVKQWKLDVYRTVWNTMRKYWQAERFIRVTDDEGLAQFIKVNELVPGPNGPALQNALGQLDVDIILDEGPDNINAMQDAQEILIQGLAQNGVPVPPDVMIEVSGLPSTMKKKLLEKFEKAAQQPPPELAMKQAELQMKGQEQQQNLAFKEKEFEVNSMLKVREQDMNFAAKQREQEMDFQHEERKIGLQRQADIEKGERERQRDSEKVEAAKSTRKAETSEPVIELVSDALKAVGEGLGKFAESNALLAQAVGAPKKVELIRDKRGRAQAAVQTPMEAVN